MIFIAIHQSGIDELNKTNINKNTAQSLSLTQSQVTVATPNNVNTNGENVTGFQITATGENKTNEQIVAENTIKNENDLVAQDKFETDSWNKAVDGNIKKLDKIAHNMFGDGMNYKGEGAFIFGVGSPKQVGKNNNSNISIGDKVTNSTKNGACGAIDFTKVSGSTARDKLINVAIQNDIKSRLDVGRGKTWEDAVKNQSSLYSSIDKNKLDGAKQVLLGYQKVYMKYQGAIQKVALEYVNTINEKARFAKRKDGEQEINQAEIDNIKDEALVIANQKLADIYTNFEQDLIKTVHNAYVSIENERDKAIKKNPNIKQGSISDLAQRDEQGNFVSFIEQARRNADTDGWITAGMWTMAITRSISELQELVSVRPDIQWAETDNNKFAQMLGNLKMPTSGLSAGKDIENWYGMFDQHSMFSPLQSIINRRNKPVDTTNALAALGTGFDLTDMFDTGRHPVIILTEAGHNLISTAQNFMAYTSYWQVRSSTKKYQNSRVAPDMNNPASTGQIMLSHFVGAIMVMGFIMAYYLPVLPFLIWLGACLGWLISVVEAMVIAPLWGAMHLHPKGSQLVGKGETGYQILLSILLRPSLMTIGLIASIVITQVFGIFVNYIFAIGMKLSLGSEPISSNITVAKVIWILAVYFIYVLFMQSLFTKMYGIITISDNILKWIGIHSSNTTEYSQIGVNEVQGKLNALAGSGGGAYASILKDKGEQAAMKDQGTVSNPSQTGAGYREMNQRLMMTTNTAGARSSGYSVDNVSTVESSGSAYMSANRNSVIYDSGEAINNAGFSETEAKRLKTNIANSENNFYGNKSIQESVKFARENTTNNAESQQAWRDFASANTEEEAEKALQVFKARQNQPAPPVNSSVLSSNNNNELGVSERIWFKDKN